MKKCLYSKLRPLLLLALVVMASCDEGDILPREHTDSEQAYTARLVARVTGMRHWTPSYSLNVAAFSDESDYSLIQKQLLPSDIREDGSLDIVLSHIPLAATDVQLCVCNSLRHRILTLASVRIKGDASPADTLQLVLDGPADLSLYGTIQSGLFDGSGYSCTSCHRDNAPRAGLSLSGGSSYGQLVDHASTRVEGGIRVVPGDAAASILHQVLAEGNEAGLAFDHSNMVDATAVKLLDEWINSGAME